MDDIKTIVECQRGRNHPDGSGRMCRYIKDGVIYHCNAFISVKGKDPFTGVKYENEWKCADVWTPILAGEVARTNRGQTAAIEGLRNIVATGSEQAQKKIDQAIEEQKRLS